MPNTFSDELSIRRLINACREVREAGSVFAYPTPDRGNTIPARLLSCYRKTPSMTNRAKLQKYLDTYPLWVLMSTQAEVAFLRANEFKGV